MPGQLWLVHGECSTCCSPEPRLRSSFRLARSPRASVWRRDPVVDAALQNRQGLGARADQQIVKAFAVEPGTEYFFGFAAQLRELDHADHVTGSLTREGDVPADLRL